MSIHKHDWWPRSDIGQAMYSCECGMLGRRIVSKVVAQPFEQEPRALTVNLKDQPRKKDYEGTGTSPPKRVHRSGLPDLGVGQSRAFKPSPTYKRVCIAMFELGADRPLQVIADLAGCSIAFVRDVQNHVMQDDFTQEV